MQYIREKLDIANEPYLPSNNTLLICLHNFSWGPQLFASFLRLYATYATKIRPLLKLAYNLKIVIPVKCEFGESDRQTDGR